MEPSSDHRFLAKHHVRRGADFRRAYGRRCSAGNTEMVIYGYPNESTFPRLGISASRRIGNAVVRNRWKRLLREAFRLSREKLPSGIDLIVVPRPAARPTLASLLESLPRLASAVARKLSR
jgi:ribonuclease P protein component